MQYKFSNELQSFENIKHSFSVNYLIGIEK
jgi:hypothetical protein